MSDMIERVARAIYAERYLVEIAFGAMPAWEDVQGSDRTGTFDEARAALEAMREPTEAMTSATSGVVTGCDGEYGDYNVYCDDRVAGEIWTAMIDAALSNSKGGEG